MSNELAAGEHILWYGQPDATMSMMSKWPVAVFGLIFTAITASFLNHAWSAADVIGSAIGVIFVAGGIYLLTNPAIEMMRAKGTLFAITESRLLVIRRHGGHLQSLARTGIRQIERIERRKGRLTLRIPTSLVSDGDGGQRVDYLELHGVPNADHVFRLLTGSTCDFRG